MTEEMSNDSRSWGPVIAKWAFLLLTLVLFGAVVYTMKSVLHAIILGVLFAMLLMPVHSFILEHVERWLGRKKAADAAAMTADQIHRARRIDSRNRSIASALTVSFVFFVIVIPLSMFTISVGKQGFSATLSAQRWLLNEFPGKVHALIEKYDLEDKFEQLHELYDRLGLEEQEAEEPIVDLSSDAEPDIVKEDTKASVPAVAEPELKPEQSGQTTVIKTSGDGEELATPGELEEIPSVPHAKDIAPLVGRLVGNVLQVVRDSLLAVLSQVWILIFNFCIMLFVMYQIFYDGKNIFAYMKSISPLGDEEQRRVSSRLKQVSKAIFFGIFGTAVTQGAFAMVAFKLVGIPIFWGVVLGMCSIVPVVGTSIIWVPVTVYLAMIGEYGKAVAVFVMCGCFIANLDMMLRPLLMKKCGDTGLSYMVLFLSILGGIQTFGLVGVVYGPLIAGLCSICLLLFSTQFKGVKEPNDTDDAELEEDSKAS